MNKTELVKSVAAQVDLSDHKTEKVITAVFDTIKQQLADGGEVSIVGFGVFHVSERAERQGRNPKTGENADHPRHQKTEIPPGQAPERSG